MSSSDLPERPPTSAYLAEAIGGPRGIVDATVPTVAFVAVNATVGLSAALVVAIAASVVLLALRAVRREPLQQTFSGMFGVVIAVVIARRTGSASGFFLPGIARNALFGLVGLGSLLARRPLAGYVLAAFDQRYSRWRSDAPLRRAAYWATLLWVLLFALRAVIQGALYLADRPGWLAAANLGLGVPLYALTLLGSVAVVRRLAPASLADDVPPADRPAPLAATDPAPSEPSAYERPAYEAATPPSSSAS